MAKLLDREQLIHEIGGILKNAEDYIYLICPYIELDQSPLLIKAVENANNKGIDINIIYSKGFRKKAGQEQFKKYKRVKLCYISNLHMKVYLNEKSAIVSSLNLHDYSLKNNLECGIFMSREEDLWKQVYTMIKKDIYTNMVVEKKEKNIRGRRIELLS